MFERCSEITQLRASMVTAPAQAADRPGFQNRPLKMKPIVNLVFQLALVTALFYNGADAFIAGSMKRFSLRTSALKDSGHSLTGQRHLKLVKLDLFLLHCNTKLLTSVPSFTGIKEIFV
jgi:hypothetical protein